MKFASSMCLPRAKEGGCRTQLHQAPSEASPDRCCAYHLFFGFASYISVSSDSYGFNRSSGSSSVSSRSGVSPMQDHGDTGMYTRHQFICFYRHNDERLQPVAVLIFPDIPQASETEKAKQLCPIARRKAFPRCSAFRLAQTRPWATSALRC
jgi:hypothetical protein